MGVIRPMHIGADGTDDGVVRVLEAETMVIIDLGPPVVEIIYVIDRHGVIVNACQIVVTVKLHPEIRPRYTQHLGH